MDDDMPFSEPEEIIQVRKLIDEAKFEAASQLLDKFREKEDLTLHELISYYISKCWFAGNLFNQEDYIKYASENWKRTIAINLERAKVFLVFITPQIIKSKYVKKEISYALKKQKPFFAVYLKDTKLPTELEFEMVDIQAMMSYLMPKSEFYAKLRELISNSLNN